MKKVIFLVLLMGCFGANAQRSENKLLWEASRPLEWEDFKASPDPASSFQANTNSGISYSWSFRQNGAEANFIYEVYSFFLPEGSWVKNGKNSSNLLAHEQLHFDITELHARKLRKELKQFNATGSKDMKKVLREIYQKIDAERKAMQEQYDRETDHSQRENVQKEWQKKIEEELAKFDEFSS